MTDQQEANAVPRIGAAALNEESMAARRVTVGLVQRVRAELWALMHSTQLSLTDAVNRAISIYYLVDAHQRAGYDLVFRHQKTGDERVVEIL